jgi:hypothetical protein
LFAAIAVALDDLTVDDARLLARTDNSVQLLSDAVAFGLIRDLPRDARATRRTWGFAPTVAGTSQMDRVQQLARELYG